MALPVGSSIVSDLDSLKEQFGLIPVMIGDVHVDVVKSYSAPVYVELTEFAVEAGMAVSDHRRVLPQSVMMEIVLTDPSTAGLAIAKAAISGTLESDLANGWRDKRDRLLEISNSDKLITVQTPEKLYSSFTITSIRDERTAQTLNSFSCTVEMRELRKVSSALADVDLSSVPKSVEEKQTDAQKDASKRSSRTQGQGNNPARNAKKRESTILYNLALGE